MSGKNFKPKYPMSEIFATNYLDSKFGRKILVAN